MKIIWKKTCLTLRVFLAIVGFFTIIFLILAFTSVPYWTRYWLGTYKSDYDYNPDYVVMLGGSGMPSEENLIRLYYTAMVGRINNSVIIIAHPPDSSVYEKMKFELMMRNIDTSCVIFEKQGANTRSQALSLVKNFPGIIHLKIVIVTSPEHVLRSVLVFRKAGFTTVGGCPAFGSDMNIDLAYDSNLLGGRKYIPDIGNNLKLRYNFWNYMKIEIICLREFVALGYYKLKNWI